MSIILPGIGNTVPEFRNTLFPVCMPRKGHRAIDPDVNDCSELF